jgi:hypothetical protein
VFVKEGIYFKNKSVDNVEKRVKFVWKLTILDRNFVDNSSKKYSIQAYFNDNLSTVFR